MNHGFTLAVPGRTTGLLKKKEISMNHLKKLVDFILKTKKEEPTSARVAYMALQSKLKGQKYIDMALKNETIQNKILDMSSIYRSIDFPVPNKFCAYVCSGENEDIIARKIANNKLWLEEFLKQYHEARFDREFNDIMLGYRQRLVRLGVTVDHSFDESAPIGVDGKPLVTQNSEGKREVFWDSVGDNEEFWSSVKRSVDLLENL